MVRAAELATANSSIHPPVLHKESIGETEGEGMRDLRAKESQSFTRPPALHKALGLAFV